MSWLARIWLGLCLGGMVTAGAAAEGVAPVAAAQFGEGDYIEIPFGTQPRYGNLWCRFDNRQAQCGADWGHFVCGPDSCVWNKGPLPPVAGTARILQQKQVVEYPDGFSCQAKPNDGVRCQDKAGREWFLSNTARVFWDEHGRVKDW